MSMQEQSYLLKYNPKTDGYAMNEKKSTGVKHFMYALIKMINK